MRISFNNCSITPRFCARNEEIRKADNIQRRANNSFNFVSSSRIDDYCDASNNYEYKIKARKVADKLKHVILATRYAADVLNETGNGIGILYADDLDLSEHTGLGNCMEYAKAAVAALCANGYYNSERVNLRYEIKFINKETGKVEYESEDPLDHSFAVTDLNCRDEKDIVIDPWMGFADYKQEAVIRFRNIYADDAEKFEKFHKKLFMLEKLEKGEKYNPENYIMETGFVFAPREIYSTEYQKQRLGEYARMVYPRLLLNKKS